MKKNRLLVVLLLPALGFFACSGKKIDAQFKHAEELIGTRKFDEAKELYKLIVTRNPNNSKSGMALLKMGDLYLYTYANSSDALEIYSKLIDKWPMTDAARVAVLRRASIFDSEGQVQKALSDYERVLKYFPDNPDRFAVRLLLAKAYLKINDPYQASIELETLINDKNTPPEVNTKALFDLGESYLFLQKYEKAFMTFSLLKKTAPDSPSILDAELRMVECLEKLDRPDEALILQEAMVKRYPDSELVKKKEKGLIRREEKLEKPEVSTKAE